MAVDGAWTIAFRTPGGPGRAEMVFRTDGGRLTGTYDGVAIQDGHTDGRELSFTAQLVSPFKVKIKASASVDGDTITGRARAGLITIPFTGTRTAA
ncbi:hypothetical protein [Actinoplanes sp. NPDC049316]|uniref:hypothetical protein n=1 Tax=Actinoplanes sp. NPDC049316 TaxID=3154727 RepID=UPI003447BDE6